MNTSEVVAVEERVDRSPPPLGILVSLARHRMRLAKSLAGLALLVVAARTVRRHLILASSSEALVTTTFIDVAAPIEGLLDRERITEGTLVSAGARLGTIKNPRIDKTTVAELQAAVDSLAGEIESLTKVIATLQSLGGTFESRGKVYRRRRAEQLSILLAQSQARVDGERARSDASELRAKRTQELAKLGLASTQTAEEAERDAAVAARALTANQRERESLVTTLKALNEGFSLGDSSAMDKSYSSQRGDDINLRLTQLNGTLVEKEARHEALKTELASLQAQVSMLSEAAVVAPRRARVWSISAADGVFVTRGAPLMRLVDCSALRVLAYVNGWSYDRLQVGDRADVVLHPGGRRYVGTIQLRLGSPDSRLPASMALSTSPDQRERYAVVVSSPELDEGLSDQCQAGQNAEVLFHPNTPNVK